MYNYSLVVRGSVVYLVHVFYIVLCLQMLKEGPDQDILIESFLSLGRVDHLTMVMALHPSYLSCFLKTQHALLELDGPLPHHWRHYIAVMVRKLQYVTINLVVANLVQLLFVCFCISCFLINEAAVTPAGWRYSLSF